MYIKLVVITIKENIELALQGTCMQGKREQHIAKVAEKQHKILENYIRPDSRKNMGNMLPMFQN